MPYLRAGVDAPFGFMPYDGVLRITPYNKDAAAVRIFVGDAVIVEADGSVAVAAAGDVNIVGVAAEGSAASTAKTDFLVMDHPDQLFTVQADDGGTALAQTNVGNNCDLLATTGDTTTERSLHEMDQSTAVATTAQLRIVALHPIEAGTFGANRKYVVRWNEHLYASTTGI